MKVVNSWKKLFLLQNKSKVKDTRFLKKKVLRIK